MKTKSPIPSSPEAQRGFPIEGHVQEECCRRHHQRPLGRTSHVCWYDGDTAGGRWCKRNHGLCRIRSKLVSYKITPILSRIPTGKTGHLPPSLRRPYLLSRPKASSWIKWLLGGPSAAPAGPQELRRRGQRGWVPPDSDHTPQEGSGERSQDVEERKGAEQAKLGVLRTV